MKMAKKIMKAILLMIKNMKKEYYIRKMDIYYMMESSLMMKSMEEGHSMKAIEIIQKEIGKTTKKMEIFIIFIIMVTVIISYSKNISMINEQILAGKI